MNIETCAQPTDQQPAAAINPPQIEVAGQQLTLFVELDPLLAAMLADIRNARRRIWLESYMFADDRAGRVIADALRARAQEGVDVRVIYDAIGSQATPSAFFTEMQQAGVKVLAHHTIWETLFRRFSWTHLNRRNHRKTLVIDDAVGYFGGMNLIDPLSANQSEEIGLPISAGWRDVHVRIAGPQAGDLGESYMRSWRREEHLPNKRRPRAYRRGRLPYNSQDVIRFFDSGPGTKYSRAARIFARLMRRAEDEILLSMAYFIPAGRVMRELLRARKRGVRVRVVVPQDNDVKLVQYALRHLYIRLLKRGIEIYERENCMLHSKAMVIDQDWSIVGSCNLDPRSLEINYEILAAIRSQPFAAELRKICENEIAHSSQVTLEQCNGRTRSQRIVDRFCYAFRWWL